ncbi:DNA-formamidopyrimidine glycosylase family protein [Mucilaginibacter galii]|uniref:Formamidopyrimidine-DNA glycosylase n=1 Tax=Mucilaginibacter galii TaxID=2005073 RepID=A0A917J6H3_9SPHI|nr:DNA-formamidopyrimidine glycosylase family protein [Mucilaginibacter galii]GGI48827.1 formamidopyrimidine-DNA glycosylase [Mucilaginibacter galii]
MPELPDLQVFSQSLNKVLKGKKLQKLNILQTKKLNVTEKELITALEGQELNRVERSGKQLHFVFKNGNVLGLHLMLHGQMHWFDGDNTNKFTILELHFEGGKGLAITDFQRQATPTLNPDEPTAPDAMAGDAGYQFWKTTLQNSRGAVKSLLLNQDIVRGIGNAYADEILYDARLSPFSIASKIPDANVKVLAKSVKGVLKNAEKQILKDNPDRISGEFRDFLQVHLPKHKTTPQGEAILQKTLSSRKTYYTDAQEMFD